MSRVFIFGALTAKYLPETPEEGDLVIAADLGFERLKEISIKPDLLVADFDSMEEIPDFEPIIRLDQRKDFTDIACAINLGFERGFTQFVIYGGAGEKLDHSLANIQLCSDILSRGGSAVFYGDRESFTVIRESFHFDRRQEGRLSVFSLTEESRGVTIKGASYEVESVTLYRRTPLGVSNAFVGREVDISVKDGELLIIWQTVSK